MEHRSPALQADSLPAEATREALFPPYHSLNFIENDYSHSLGASQFLTISFYDIGFAKLPFLITTRFSACTYMQFRLSREKYLSTLTDLTLSL